MRCERPVYAATSESLQLPVCAGCSSATVFGSFADVFPPSDIPEDVIDQPARAQFEVFLHEHREALNGCLDGLTEEQARRSLVLSGPRCWAW